MSSQSLFCSTSTIVIGGLHKDLEKIPVHSSEVALFWILDAVISCVIQVLIAVLSHLTLQCPPSHSATFLLYPILSIPSCPIRFHLTPQESPWTFTEKKMQGFQEQAFVSGCYMLLLPDILCVVALVVVVCFPSLSKTFVTSLIILTVTLIL